MPSTWNSPSATTGSSTFCKSARSSSIARGRQRTRRSTTALADVARKVELLSRPHPYLHGNRAIFGVMPDWNPAEMIGLRPWPLSLSLYRELITDAIWAYQRDNYGYKNLRSFPLLVSFHGLPYIDVRVDFNSFIPRDVSDDLAGRLVNYYIDRLLAEPHLHDKVEFEIIFSCYTLDLPKRMARLAENGFSPEDLAELSSALRRLTNRIMHGETALWRRDRAKIDLLAQRIPINLERGDRQDQPHLLADRGLQAIRHAALRRSGAGGLHRGSDAPVLRGGGRSRCRREGDIHGERRYRRVAHRAEISRNFRRQTSWRATATSGRGPTTSCRRATTRRPISISTGRVPGRRRPRRRASRSRSSSCASIEQLLKEHELDIDVLSLIEFIKAGIEGREYAKFVFTRSLSDALSLIRQLGEEHGLSAEDCAFLDYARHPHAL